MDDGRGASASFGGPSGLTIGRDGAIYVSDAPNHRIRRIDQELNVTTIAGGGPVGLTNGSFADGPALSARFNLPAGLATDRMGNLIVADKDNHRIRLISPDGMVRTLAGSGIEGHRDGPSSDAQFSFPVGVSVDDEGNIFVTEHGNNSLRQITPEGEVRTIVRSHRPYGDGRLPSDAVLAYPSGLAIGPSGGVFVANVQLNQIVKIGSDGSVAVTAGSSEGGYRDGAGPDALFRGPSALAFLPDGRIVVADSGNKIIRIIDIAELWSRLGCHWLECNRPEAGLLVGLARETQAASRVMQKGE
jgi:sugar lactone lactonase YvrE